MSSARVSWCWQPLLILVIAASARPARARAQSPISMLSDSMTALYSARNLPLTWRPVLPCAAALSAARTYRVPAFLSASTRDTTNRLQISQARDMARAVVSEIRNALGTPIDSIADGDGRVSWRSLPAVLTVKGYADGRLTRSARGPPADTSASSLLVAAFDAAERRGTAKMPWRNDTTNDPVVATFWLDVPDVDSAGSWKNPDPDEPALTAFSLLEPPHTTVHIVTTTEPRYPSSNAREQVEGDVFLRFVVDTSGRVVASTEHDVRPTNAARDTPFLAQQYSQFVEASRQWVLTSRFTPESIANCRIETAVEQLVRFRAPSPQD